MTGDFGLVDFALFAQSWDMINGNPGSDWTDQQNDLIVADYFEMLSMELAGVAYVKSHRNEGLQQLTGRSRGSIERKHMNISAVLDRLGLPRVKGYAPYVNFQAGLIDAVDRYLSAGTLPAFPDLGVKKSAFEEGRALWVGPRPSSVPNDERQDRTIERLVRKFDPAARDARNRSLGKDGERLVFEHEIQKLTAANRSDLAKKVEWTSQERGDGAGFDISSFELDGRQRLIEVKTTNGAALTPFYLTENERVFSEERPDAFKLLRIYNFADDPKAFELCPPLHAVLTLSPTSYRATLV